MTKQASAEEYWRSGGKLDRDSFEKARTTLSELTSGKKLGVRNSSLVQAESMANFSQVPITSEQKNCMRF